MWPCRYQSQVAHARHERIATLLSLLADSLGTKVRSLAPIAQQLNIGIDALGTGLDATQLDMLVDLPALTRRFVTDEPALGRPAVEVDRGTTDLDGLVDASPRAKRHDGDPLRGHDRNDGASGLVDLPGVGGRDPALDRQQVGGNRLVDSSRPLVA